MRALTHKQISSRGGKARARNHTPEQLSEWNRKAGLARMKDPRSGIEQTLRMLKGRFDKGKIKEARYKETKQRLEQQLAAIPLE